MVGARFNNDCFVSGTRCARAGILNEKLEDSGITGFHAFNAAIITVQIKFEMARIVHFRSILVDRYTEPYRRYTAFNSPILVYEIALSQLE